MDEHRALGIRARGLRGEFNRRQFFRLGAGVASLSLLAACGSSSSTPTTAADITGTAASSGTSAGAATSTVTKASTAAATSAGTEATAAGGATPTGSKSLNYVAHTDVKGTIQFSNCWGGARIPLINDWIKGFQSQYPNIKVQSQVSECSAIDKQQVAAIAGGAPPNVMMVKSDNTSFFAEQDALLSLDDLMARDKLDPKIFFPGEFASRQWKGKTYGLPNVTAGALHLIFANTGLLQKIGVDPKKKIETWQDLDALVEPAKKQGLFVLDPAKVSTGMTAHMVFTYANGGKYWDDDLKTILWNRPEGVEAAEWMLQFVKAQAGSYQNLAIASDPKNVIQPEDWASQKYVTCINGSWFFFQLQQKAPDLKYATYLFPKNAKNSASMGYTPSTGGWMFSIAKRGQDQAAAWEWLKYISASQAACDFVIKQNRPSPIVACNEEPALSQGNPYWPVVTKDLQHDIAVPTTSINPQFIQLWFDMEDAILYEKMKPKDALDKYATDGQKLLDEWNAKQK